METTTAKRVGKYHKPNKTGRAWYVFIQGERPSSGDQCEVRRRTGHVDTVTVDTVEPYTTHYGEQGYLCRFTRVTGLEGGEEFIGKDDIAQEVVEALAPKPQSQVTQMDLSALVEAIAQGKTDLRKHAEALRSLLDVRVAGSIKSAMERVVGRVEYVNASGATIDCGHQHKAFPDLLKWVQMGLNVWVPGPAGSGKTTAARMVAKALGLSFYHSGKVLMEHQLVGYMDAHGRYVATVFYKAYSEGGLFLQDEADGSEAKALLALNMAIENGEMAFPCGIVKRHKDFRLIAAANTFGHGADSDYVGRNPQDKAFLDRFVTLPWGYDEDFETMLAGNPMWCARVQSLRAKAKAKGIKVLITPRASIVGAQMLAAGIPQDKVEAATIRKAMSDQQWESIQ